MRPPLPLTLGRLDAPFDDPEWIYEVKYDGLRALAILERGRCRFFSRNRYPLIGLADLTHTLVSEIKADQAVLDGELAVTDAMGRSVFASIMRDRRRARYCAFDLLWLNGEDLRGQPLLERKARLKRILPADSKSLLYVDHVVRTGTQLFQAALDLDLEGIVAKRADSPYALGAGRPPWITINNCSYSQQAGRHELFDPKDLPTAS
jgi:bifunctional non-homologous end joining protein LigD